MSRRSKGLFNSYRLPDVRILELIDITIKQITLKFEDRNLFLKTIMIPKPQQDYIDNDCCFINILFYFLFIT